MRNLVVLIQTFLFLFLGISSAICRSGRREAQIHSISSSYVAQIATYFIPCYVIGSGGVLNAAGTTYRHSATAGETVLGDLQSSQHGLLSGFWQPAAYRPGGAAQEETRVLTIRLTRATGGSKITADKIGVRAGDPADFAATVTDSAGTPLDEPVMWRVEGDAGSIDQDGHFMASTRAGSQGLLIATVHAVYDSVWVSIVPNLLKHIEITPASVELHPGERIMFKAQGYDAYGNKVNTRPFWHVTRDIGTISSVTGTFVAGDRAGSGDVVAFAQTIFGDASTEVSGAAKVVVRAVSEAFRLYPNVPNPFNPSTTIRYDLPMSGRVTLLVYDLSGRIVKKIVDAHQGAGTHTAIWDSIDEQGMPVASGIYVGRLEVWVRLGAKHGATVTQTRKMVLVR